MKTPLQLKDLFSLLSPSQQQLSPDGKLVAYVLQGFRENENDRYQNLWLVAADGQSEPHRLTRGAAKDSSPAWSPCGRFLAFLSTRPHELEVAQALADTGKKGEPAKEQDEKPSAQIWVLDMKLGGEPRQLTWREEGIGDFDWSPCSGHIVFSARDPDEKQQAYLKSIRGKAKPHEKGPLVIDRVQHKHDTHGYLDDVREHLFVVERVTRQVRRLTDGPCSEEEPRWSPDGAWIGFVSNRTGDADNNRRADLWLVSADGSTVRRLTRGDVDASRPRWSPDSKHLAFVTPLQPENAYVLRHVLVVDRDDFEEVPDLIAEVGRGWSEIGGVVNDLCHGDPAQCARVYPVPLASTPSLNLTLGLDRIVVGAPQWVNERQLVVTVGDRGQTRLAALSLDHPATILWPDPASQSTLDGHISGAGSLFAVATSEPAKMWELCLLSLETLTNSGSKAGATALTRHNQWLSDRLTPQYERLTFSSSEGAIIEAWVVLPPEFDRSRRAPLVAKIHGGPMAYDSPEFRFDTQYIAGQGYIVLLVNYRGSTSFGEAFCESIRGDWGPREHEDIMNGVQAVIDMGYADENRLFCTGFSQGGIMTNWAVGHTDRFKAAVSEHGMWDYVAAFGTDDCHLWWQDDLGVPWHNEAQYQKIAPVSGLMNIKTPLLITAGELDWRCPLNQSEQLYLALKKRGVPTQLVIYQGERHAITAPKRAIDRIERILGWFAQWNDADKGRCI